MTEAISNYLKKYQTVATEFIDTHSHDIVTVTTLATVAHLINRVWDKYLAASFLVLAALAYPSLREKVKLLLHTDTTIIPQALLAAAVPFATAISPYGGIAMALSLLMTATQSEIEHAKIASQQAAEIKTLKLHNQTLQTTLDSLQTSADQLEKEINDCLNISQLPNANPPPLNPLRSKLDELTILFTQVKSSKAVLERLAVLKEIEAAITQIKDEISTVKTTRTDVQELLALLKQKILKLPNQP